MKLTQLLKEYSEKIMKTLVERYKKQRVNLDEANIRYYINRFDELKNSIRQRVERGDQTVIESLPKELVPKDAKDLRFLDILQWKKFSELEKIIDVFPAPPSASKAIDVNDAETDAAKVYDKDGLEIYEGDSQHKCVKYGHGMGKSYSWCISRQDSSNMYSSYRFGKETSRMFYFVFDRSRPKEDKFHAVVIHVFENGKWGLSNATNAGDEIFNKWEELGSKLPADLWDKLKPLKSIFKYNPPSDEEKEVAALSGKELSTEQFVSLPHRTKLQYINLGKILNKDQIMSLDLELKNQYINLGNVMPFEAIKDNIPLMKRYITIQFKRKNSPVDADYLEYMDEDMKKEYWEKYKDEAYITFDHVIKYFHDELKSYIKDFIDNLIYLPKEMEPYMDDKQKKLWNMYMPAYSNVKIENHENKSLLIREYYLVPNEITLEQFNHIKSEQKKSFLSLLKNLIKNNNIEQYEYLNRSIPEGREIKDNQLYLKFGEKWVGEDNLNESQMDKYQLYKFKRYAGIIR